MLSENIVEKIEKDDKQHFLIFETNVSCPVKELQLICSIFRSVICRWFEYEESKNLPFDKNLNRLDINRLFTSFAWALHCLSFRELT